MSKKTLNPFKQALLDVQLEKWKDIPSENGLSLTFSEEFEKNGRKLISKTKHENIRKASTTARRIILVAAVLAALAITALAIPSVRQELMQFFASDAGDHYEFRFDPELLDSAPKEIEKVYKPTYAPAGWQEDAIITTNWVVYVWRSSSGECITFGQYPISNEDVRPQPNIENIKRQWLSLNGRQVLCMENDSNRMYFWTDNAYFYRLVSSKTVSEEEINKIFSSIQENKNAVVRK